jgi:maltooligosyltrehalose trehalohydrolase
MAVLLDVVYNHLGPYGNHLAKFGPYFTDRYKTPWGPAMNLDGAGCDEVRRFLCDNALMWLRDYHFDGLRLDAVHAIYDQSATHFLEELAIEVEALEARVGRNLVLIAESDLNDPRLLRSRDAGGFGLHAQWSDDFHHALHAALTGERDGYYSDFGRLEHLTTALRQAYVYDGRVSVYRGRRHGRAATNLSGHRFLAYLQNHDQVGNRARGDRSSGLLSLGRLKIGAALVLTSPFIPMLFQGEEWGASSPFQYFTDHDDPALGEAVTCGRKEEFAAFGWDPADIPDPQSIETFNRSKLDWTELDAPGHREILEWHRALIRLRRSCPALTDGRMDGVHVRYDDDAGWLALDRGAISVVSNLSSRRQTMPLWGDGARAIVLSSDPDNAVRSGKLTLAGESVAVLRVE